MLLTVSARAPAVVDYGDEALEVLASATRDAAVTALRIGFALMLIVAVSDAAFTVAQGGGARAIGEGTAFAALAALGYARPNRAAVLLTPPGRVVLVAALFGAAGIVDWGVQDHFAEVAPAIVWIAVIVSSARWVVLTVFVSALGYIGGLALQGHAVAWMTDGPGRDLVANQVVDLIANAGAVALLVALLRRFLASVPMRLAEARVGGGMLTPQLNAAVRGGAVALLGRGDPSAIVAALNEGERTVLDLLARGLAPKQAALELNLSLAAVRTRIANAKRKTGARTLEQLVALYAEGSNVR